MIIDKSRKNDCSKIIKKSENIQNISNHDSLKKSVIMFDEKEIENTKNIMRIERFFERQITQIENWFENLKDTI